MTGRTASRDPRMIHRGPRPESCRRFMARLARLGCRNVRRGLAFGLGAVMASGAARRDARVIISVGHKLPIRRAHSVARVTRSSCRHVPSRLSAGLNPVMTGPAGSRCDPLMCESSPRPTDRPMAGVTRHGRRHMCSRLAYRGRLVMTLGAGSRSNTVMGKERRCPTCRPVAATAVD
jgi:hypothetical protein